MKFIRDLMSRKPKDAPVQKTPSFDDDVKPFEDVIGQGDLQSKFPESESPLAPPMARSAKIEIRRDAPESADETAPVLGEEDMVGSEESNKILEKLSSRLTDEAPAAAPAGGVNIWDIDDENDTVEAAPAAAPPARRRRNATRVLGFDANSSDVVSMFDDAPEPQAPPRAKFPVGWLLVADGPGRGECFTLEAGMSQIGRGEDQAIQLDFGDNSISRTNHAAVVYDTESHSFSLGHGGKKNVVRLNGQPVISNETLKTGDKIKIGETTLHFVPCCTEDFNWSEDKDSGENENVAIA